MRGGLAGKESVVVRGPDSAEDAACSRLVDASLEEGARVGADIRAVDPASLSLERSGLTGVCDSGGCRQSGCVQYLSGCVLSLLSILNSLG